MTDAERSEGRERLEKLVRLGRQVRERLAYLEAEDDPDHAALFERTSAQLLRFGALGDELAAWAGVGAGRVVDLMEMCGASPMGGSQ